MTNDAEQNDYIVVRQQIRMFFGEIADMDVLSEKEKIALLDNIQALLDGVFGERRPLEEYLGKFLSSATEVRAIEKILQSYDQLMLLYEYKPWGDTFGTRELREFQDACRAFVEVIRLGDPTGP